VCWSWLPLPEKEFWNSAFDFGGIFGGLRKSHGFVWVSKSYENFILLYISTKYLNLNCHTCMAVTVHLITNFHLWFRVLNFFYQKLWVKVLERGLKFISVMWLIVELWLWLWYFQQLATDCRMTRPRHTIDMLPASFLIMVSLLYIAPWNMCLCFLIYRL